MAGNAKSDGGRGWVGRSIRRLEDPTLVAGRGRFAGDLPAARRDVIAQRIRANSRRGFASAIASISAADNCADRSSASGSMSAGGNE